MEGLDLVHFFDDNVFGLAVLGISHIYMLNQTTHYQTLCFAYGHVQCCRWIQSTIYLSLQPFGGVWKNLWIKSLANFSNCLNNLAHMLYKCNMGILYAVLAGFLEFEMFGTKIVTLESSD